MEPGASSQTRRWAIRGWRAPSAGSSLAVISLYILVAPCLRARVWLRLKFRSGSLDRIVGVASRGQRIAYNVQHWGGRVCNGDFGIRGLTLVTVLIIHGIKEWNICRATDIQVVLPCNPQLLWPHYTPGNPFHTPHLPCGTCSRDNDSFASAAPERYLLAPVRTRPGSPYSTCTLCTVYRIGDECDASYGGQSRLASVGGNMQPVQFITKTPLCMQSSTGE